MKTLIRRQHPIWNGFPSLFDEMMSEWNTGSYSQGQLPATNIQETNDAFKLNLAVPGMRKEDFKIEVEQNSLKISGESTFEKVENESNFTRKEFSCQSFTRNFNLPQDKVNLDAIEAVYENGILSVNIPKRSELKQNISRTISIS